MSKYDTLTRFLKHQAGTAEYPIDQLNELVPGGLPASARKYEAWWNNNDPSHHHCQSWATAGFTAHPDLRRAVVRFDPIRARSVRAEA
jgi:hypothetical protein